MHSFFRHVRDIYHWWWTMVIGAWGAFWGVDEAINKWADETTRKWWEVHTSHMLSSWQGWIAGFLFITVLLILFGSYQHSTKRTAIHEHKYGELLEVNRSLAKRFSPNLSLGGKGYEIQPSPTVSAGPCIYLQLLPKCASQAAVEDCRGHLISISKWSGTNWAQIYAESLKLEWSVYGGHSANLDPNAEYRLNLLWWLESDKAFRLAIKTIPLALESIFNETDIFLFAVRLAARDCEPLDIYILAKWGKKWDTPVLELTRSLPVRPATLHPPLLP